MDSKRFNEEFAPGDGAGDGDVWYLIFNHCNLRDCIRMGAVCKKWLSVSKWSIRSRPSQLPWLMMLYNHSFDSLEKDEDEGVRCLFSLSDKTMFGIKFPEICGKRCCGSFTNGWLMMIDDENLDIRLFHPWQRIQLQLPDFPISIPPPIAYKQLLLHSSNRWRKAMDPCEKWSRLP
ncbi:hypothetical protein MRB53_005929 [Persea americana]|uniref:Uncharacterized protein n=1 Tax=Persea americana TaxID=3435 RepID=A0ACC2MFK2_PERAE|nr:hypothetical protein MRB53_005929 [Persea americana]